METYSFFPSSNGDRRYRGRDWANYFASLIGNGVIPNPAGGLQVVAGEGMQVIVSPGVAYISGYRYENTDAMAVELANADGVLKRIDRIVVRWDLAERKMTTQVKSSAPASSPVAPALQRDADVFELCLADIAVDAGSLSIRQADITDRRYDTTLCGIVTGLIQQIDATELTAQLNDYMARFESESREQFEDWYNDVKDLLDPDAAGQLAAAVLELREDKLDRALTAIPENADLDTYIQDGDFSATNSVAETILNTAGNTAFDLRVRGIDGVIAQHQLTIDGLVDASRHKSAEGTWTGWATRPDFGRTKFIQPNDDLNDAKYKVVGTYACGSNDAAATVLNCPTTSAFYMEVYAMGETIQQRITAFDGSRVYIRGYYAWTGAWGGWRAPNGYAVLWEGNLNANGTTATLVDSIHNYGTIAVVGVSNDPGAYNYYPQANILPVRPGGASLGYSAAKESWYGTNALVLRANVWLSYRFSSVTTLAAVDGFGESARITAVYGWA